MDPIVRKLATIELTSSRDISLMILILQAADIRLHREETNSFDSAEVSVGLVNDVKKMIKYLTIELE